MPRGYTVRVLNQISPAGLKRLPGDHYTVGKDVEAPDAILVRSADLHGMDIPASVQAIGRAGAGTNNIPVAALSGRGIAVFNAPGANANAVKELVIAGMLLASRNLLPAQVRKAGSVAEVLKSAHFISLHVPLVDATRHLVNAHNIGLLRPGAVLLNFARDGVVDEAGVLAALQAGNLAWYVCDFPSRATLAHERVIALPHLGASTREAEENCAVMVIDQLRGYLEHGNIANAVNFPAVSMARESAFRIAIANANVPNMLGQISTAMANAGLNIHNMVNKSRGDMAYTLVDVDSAVPAEVIDKIGSIKGVLAVRYLPLH